jgi:hypothetical protein
LVVVEYRSYRQNSGDFSQLDFSSYLCYLLLCFVLEEEENAVGCRKGHQSWESLRGWVFDDDALFLKVVSLLLMRY